ncbi:hypothetical protein GCM10010121_064100 [Streptomyces brasiliensis]|uniref:Uncharacterized protein n=1 Tax=Streptomyces brasiliensis TaxID=1954 RepID=A0A917L5J2_9ACTN|nr:hypothetical protein GCM10010121_064100 [Streptomyces brasiliensis]
MRHRGDVTDAQPDEFGALIEQDLRDPGLRVAQLRQPGAYMSSEILHVNGPCVRRSTPGRGMLFHVSSIIRNSIP